MISREAAACKDGRLFLCAMPFCPICGQVLSYCALWPEPEFEDDDEDEDERENERGGRVGT